MDTWWRLPLLLLLLVVETTLGKDPCEDLDQLECPATDERCIQNVEARVKRQAACPFALAKIDACNKRRETCVVQCAGNATCKATCPICPSISVVQPEVTGRLVQGSISSLQQGSQRVAVGGDCDKRRTICLSQCRGDQTCEGSCPVCPVVSVVAPNQVGRNIIVEDASGGPSHRYHSVFPAGGNITTVIRLSNIINNTNHVNVPTNINSTNINNITIFDNASSEEGGRFGLGYNEDGPCCMATLPKTCAFTSSGPRCRHHRRRTCGHQCTSREIHAQSRRRCGPRGCQTRLAYVPQPRSRCHYSNAWPFVRCGSVRSRSCGGCYDHYGVGFKTFHGDQEPDCDGCFDEGFDYGQMYRRGPVFRPFYYHEPPCFLTGMCPFYVNQFGVYGHEMIDPVWGSYGSSGVQEGVVEEEDEDEPDDSDGWKVVLTKCKVISGNGTEELKNCTSIKDHPYASAPALPADMAPQPLPARLMPEEEQWYAPPHVRPARRKHRRNSRQLRGGWKQRKARSQKYPEEE